MAEAITRILIASPIQQKPVVLSHFLQGLDQLDSTAMKHDFMFVDDNTDEDSKLVLLSFADDHPGTLILPSEEASRYHIDEHTHYWNEELTWKVGRFKDAMLAHALRENYDAVFFVDSDLIVHPNTVQQLWRTKKPIVSSIFWTRWQPHTIEMPQVWLQDVYTLYPKGRNETLSDAEVTQRTHQFLAELREPGLYEVGGLGACTLIQRSALEAGVCFAEIKNLSFWGEDRHFCIRAAALGLPLYVDTHWPAYHIYRSADIAGVEAYREAVQRDPRIGEREKGGL